MSQKCLLKCQLISY